MKEFLPLPLLLLSFLFTCPDCTCVRAQTTEQAPTVADFFAPLHYRSIGPFRGGRSVAASGVVGDPLTYYMGTTGGGLWKTTDGGQRWNNVSDGYFRTGSVGAVAVSRSHPRIVYAGMGEHAPRGVMTTHGDGVYRSDDGGKSWKHLGLEQTHHISRVVIHPDNPDVVYVAAQGQLYGPNEERGVYRTTDGGANWERVLYVNDLTGASELSMDAANPNVLYAAMWHHQRLPWQVVSGGAGSGFYKSTDGGTSWTELTKGLPEEKGKLAIAVSPANSERVYALVESDSEAEKGGLFVSADAGASFDRISADHRLTQRAWYYLEVFADPNNEQVVYVLSAAALRSIDGGKSWERLSGTHGDYHDLWINPDNSRNLCIANDGGAAVSFDYGANWSKQDRMPTGQFYRISVDNQSPYRIYGGQQDNTSVSIASRSASGHIGPRDWEPSAGGESAFLAFDPDDPRYVMGGSYLGTIEVIDREAEASTKIMSEPIQYLGRAASEMKYRFNWNAPIVRSVHEEDTYYHAAQKLLRTRDRGQNWEEASPDLTRNQKDKQIKGGGPYTVEAVGAENYGTISYVRESPHTAGVIWVGTDDGRVQLTRDNGGSWTDVSPREMGETLVNAIEVSPHDPATAYIATTRYKFNDLTPKAYRTTDYGTSWTDISADLPYGAYTRVIREDTERRGLLFAGTEKGVFVSLDNGTSWHSFNLNLPRTPVTDLKVAHDDLIVATSGRAFWVLDDLELLRQYRGKPEGIKLYAPAPVMVGGGRSPLDANGNEVRASDPEGGVNPASGAVIYYYLPPAADSAHIRLSITDTVGDTVRVFSSEPAAVPTYAGGPPKPTAVPASAGLNRFVWDLRYPSLTGAPTAYIEGSFRGHRAGPGAYTVHLTVNGGEQLSTPLTVKPNPSYDLSPADYASYHDFMQKAEAELNAMHRLVNDLKAAREQLADLEEKLREEGMDGLADRAKGLHDDMLSWDSEMVQRKSKAYDDVENFPNKFTANYLFVLNHAESRLPRVNAGTRSRMDELNEEWGTLRQRGRELLQSRVLALNEALMAEGVGAVWRGK